MHLAAWSSVLTLGHPHLGLSGCGTSAHPSSRAGSHGMPIGDPNLRLELFYALQENRGPFLYGQQPFPYGGAFAPLRLPDGVFHPDAEHIVLLRYASPQPVHFEALVTVSDGVFDERGRRGTGLGNGPLGDWINEGPSVGCHGRRALTIRWDEHEQLFLWRAPPNTTDPSNVTVMATVSFQTMDPFRQATFSLSSSTDLNVPDSFNASIAPDVNDAALAYDLHGHFATTTVVHAWLSVVAFLLVFPLSAALARYAKARLGPAWIRWHRVAGWTGLGLAVMASVAMEIHKSVGGHARFVSLHAKVGLAAYMLAAAQPTLGWLRPAKDAGQRRTVWRWAHILCAIGLLATGTYASVSGIQKARVHQIANADLLEGSLYGWLVACAAALLLIELWRRRRLVVPHLGRTAHGDSVSHARRDGIASQSRGEVFPSIMPDSMKDVVVAEDVQMGEISNSL